MKKWIDWIASFFSRKPEIEYKYTKNDKENQIQEIEIYKDGEYSHTVRVHYFTSEQISFLNN